LEGDLEGESTRLAELCSTCSQLMRTATVGPEASSSAPRACCTRQYSALTAAVTCRGAYDSIRDSSRVLHAAVQRAQRRRHLGFRVGRTLTQAVTRHPPISLHTSVARTQGYTYGVVA
jgi:hypothetical protein